jgi:hypothetical protein
MAGTPASHLSTGKNGNSSITALRDKSEEITPAGIRDAEAIGVRSSCW